LSNSQKINPPIFFTCLWQQLLKLGVDILKEEMQMKEFRFVYCWFLLGWGCLCVLSDIFHKVYFASNEFAQDIDPIPPCAIYYVKHEHVVNLDEAWEPFQFTSPH